MVPVPKPILMVDKPHNHDFDQFLCFFGSNPTNLFDLGAEIEVVLGKEGGKHIVDTTSIVYIPKGLIHCPVTFKRVDKPVFHLDIFLAPEYTRSVGDMSGHPQHSDYERYSPEEIKKLRGSTSQGK